MQARPDNRNMTYRHKIMIIKNIGLTRVAGAVPVDPFFDPNLAKNGSFGNSPLN
jgi:hypothetical protein